MIRYGITVRGFCILAYFRVALLQGSFGKLPRLKLYSLALKL